jgi:hypothetical protein
MRPFHSLNKVFSYPVSSFCTVRRTSSLKYQKVVPRVSISMFSLFLVNRVLVQKPLIVNIVKIVIFDITYIVFEVVDPNLEVWKHFPIGHALFLQHATGWSSVQ